MAKKKIEYYKVVKNLNEFTKDLNKYHDEMHENLECIVNLDDSDEAFEEMSYVIEEIKENFDVTYQDLLKYTGLSKNYFPSWESILYADKNQRYKIVRYFRSVLYSGKFFCIPKDKFGELIEMLMKEFNSEFKRKQLAKIVGISQNDIGKIENGERAFSAEKQKEILTFFYNSCFDDMNFRKPEFDMIREFLYNLLGKNLCTHEKRFYDMYFSFISNPDEEKAELSRLSGISLIDTEGIFSEEDFSYYPNKLDMLSCLMLNRSKEIIQTESLNKNDIWYYRPLINRYLDKNYKDEKYEVYQKMEVRQVAEWFPSLPDILKDIVFEFMLKQFETEKNNTIFHDYIIIQSESKYHVYYSNAEKLFLFLIVIRMFRDLSSEDKNRLLAELRKNIPVYPADQHCENAEKSYKECAISSFYMSSLVGDKTLSEKYKDAPVNNSVEANLYTKKRYDCLWPSKYIHKPFLEDMLDFTADEWQLVGYMELAVLNSFPLDKIFGMLIDDEHIYEIYGYLYDDTIYYIETNDDISYEVYEEDF